MNCLCGGGGAVPLVHEPARLVPGPNDVEKFDILMDLPPP